MTHPAMYNKIIPWPTTAAEAENYLRNDEWPVCDHNIDCVLNKDIKDLMTESDIADADHEASCDRREIMMQEA